MQTILGKHWHHMPAEEVLDHLDSHAERGLDLFEIQHRRERFGPNQLTAQREQGPLIRFLAQFHQPLVYVLLVAGGVTAALKEVVDSLVILGVVLGNAVIGFLQESKALRALAALAKSMTSEATVIRSGAKKRIAASELVIGDIVLLQPGDKVPADLRLVKCRELQIEEAALTGESLPVLKCAEPLAHDTLLADRRNMAYSSTLVTSGTGTGVVVAVGDSTEIGRISGLIAGVDVLATPLTKKISHFSHLLVYVILGLAGCTWLLGYLRGEPAVDMFMAAVALAVGAIPEGLPAAMTITLAIGVARMARRNAIIRKLPAVETLGSTTVICSDKTGTLTQNQMTVQRVWAGGTAYGVSGVGYVPKGSFEPQGEGVPAEQNQALRECLIAGLLCNEATLREEAGAWRAEGDPTESALLVSAGKAGLWAAEAQKALPRLDVIPFESEHQYMATLHDAGPQRPRIVYLKGSLERLLPRCVRALDARGEAVDVDAAGIEAQAQEMAGQALRVLAFAKAELGSQGRSISHAELPSGLTFLGLQGMMDPPRPEAISAVRACQGAGIMVKMITGDHVATASAIAEQIGLGAKGQGKAKVSALTGAQLAKLSDQELIDSVEGVSVFARVSPEQKLRLVEALQTRGHVVAMTGDGVNDAPALRRADIGVAMGITGTEVAKEAADMVLTDDNFASIEAAVEEGRGVFDNLVKFISWTLPTNVGEGLVILVAILLGTTLPILPLQILWINMTTALLLGMTLAFEPKEPGIMQRPARDPDEPILTRPLLVRIGLVSGLLVGGAFGLFELALARGASQAAARAVAVNVFVIGELFYLFNCRSLRESFWRLGLFSNIWAVGGASLMVLAQIAFTHLPAMNRVFQTAPIGAVDWLLVIAVGAIISAVIGVEKRLRTGGQGGLSS